MKNYYLFFFLIASISINGQSNCDNANSYLVNAYSHVKDSYDSNNISHLKYYANRSVESFKLAKENLNSCNCITALDLANKAIDLLAKVENAETFEDGRFFVKRGRDIAKESVIEIDQCSYDNSISKKTDTTATTTSVLDENNDELVDLEKEQLKLKEQQDALKLKQDQIINKLKKQKKNALAIKKQKLISSYKIVVSSNIESYNQALKTCDCNHNTIKNNNTSENLSEKSIVDIKNYFINNLKELASDYLSELNSCK